jgi:hypothetical protein
MKGLLRLDGATSEVLTTMLLTLLNARSADAFLRAERATHSLFSGLADKLVGAVLRHLTTNPDFVEPCREHWLNVAARQGERLQSNGYKKTSVQLLGGSKIELQTLRLARVAPKKPGRKRGTGKRGKAGTGVYPALAQLGALVKHQTLETSE